MGDPFFLAEEFGATVLRDMARWFEVTKRGGIKPQ
jgi:hypothetical protein